MNKISLSFFAGALSVGATAFVTGPRPSAFGFALGIMIALATVIALIGSAKRTRRVARFLLIVADGLDGKQTMTMERRTAAVEAFPGPVERDVISALQNFGMPRKAAVELAHGVVESNPNADVIEATRIALTRTTFKKAAAR